MAEKHSIRTKQRRKTMKGETDYISQLPDEILCSILSYCTVRDVVNSNLLSRRWRGLGVSMSNLDFDWDSMFRTHKDKDCNHECDCLQYQDRFVRGVNQFLQNYANASLTSFRVLFCLDRDYKWDIDRWIESAVSKGVERLDLCFSCENGSYRFDPRPVSPRMSSYIFHYELLSQADAPKLQYLSLSMCLLGQCATNQFSCLKSLHLEKVILDDCDVGNIFTCFMNLESLTLRSCRLPSMTISSSVRRLKFLAVLDCIIWGVIELSATTLTSFEYYGDLNSFNFSKVRNLRKIYLESHGQRRIKYVLEELAKKFPPLETLSVMVKESTWVSFIPKCMNAFSMVKKLDIFMPNMILEVIDVVETFNACPLLENLHLVVYLITFSGDLLAVEPMAFTEDILAVIEPLTFASDCKHLKKVHIGCFHYLLSYIQLALYFLEFAEALEQIVIDPKSKVYPRVNAACEQDHIRVAWKEGEREKVWLQLKEHSKSSVISIL